MSTLIVVGYDERFKAEEVRIKLQKLQREYLLDLEDAVVAFKDEKGRIKLDQAVNMTAKGAASGGFWGALVGLIFLNPLLGFAMGAAAGAVSGALTDVGINDNFMKELAATMAPGSSTLFVLVRKSTPDKVLEELEGTGGRVLKTSLSNEDEAKLQAALSAATSTNIKPFQLAGTASHVEINRSGAVFHEVFLGVGEHAFVGDSHSGEEGTDS